MRLVAAILSWPLTLLALGGAQAQPVADPIGAILDRPGVMTPEMEEPDMASAPVRPEPEPVLRPAYPAAAVPAPSRRPQLTEPVHVDETGKTPDAPPTLTDLAYESRIRSSIASAQRFQGPLDGGWTLSAGGADVYALQLVDRGKGELEGAWRDLRHQGAIGSSGFVDQIESQGPDLTLRFTLASGAQVEAVLHATYDGGWSGEFVESGQSRAAQLRRKN